MIILNRHNRSIDSYQAKRAQAVSQSAKPNGNTMSKIDEQLTEILGSFAFDVMYDNSQVNEHLKLTADKIKDLFGYTEAKPLEERKLDFMEELRPFVGKYGRSMVYDFYIYWTEHSVNGKKMRFEKQKVFDIGRRLVIWAKNQQKFSIANLLKGK